MTKRFLSACAIPFAGASVALAVGGVKLALVTLICGFVGYGVGVLVR